MNESRVHAVEWIRAQLKKSEQNLGNDCLPIEIVDPNTTANEPRTDRATLRAAMHGPNQSRLRKELPIQMSTITLEPGSIGWKL